MSLWTDDLSINRHSKFYSNCAKWRTKKEKQSWCDFWNSDWCFSFRISSLVWNIYVHKKREKDWHNSDKNCMTLLDGLTYFVTLNSS
uniref:Uncharacterized protein n=1 Tax=Arundo donax TaxID=35708 RepID=A0A0A9F0C8_ARUDO